MKSCRFLQEDENCSDVAYSKYQSLFFIRLLNFCGLRSRSRWNLQQIAASYKSTVLFYGEFSRFRDCNVEWELRIKN